MQRILAGILLSTLLLVQTAKAPLMLQWQQLANESFSELFCVNQALEPAPMCFGSCQIDGLEQQMTDSSTDTEGSIGAKPISPAGALYCILPGVPVHNLAEIPPFVPSIAPATEPNLKARNHVRAVFAPPMIG